jgi:hypothetical protein
MIVERRRRRGYPLHAPDSPEAEALLSERGLTRADLDRALAELERTEGIAIRTIAGINDDGVFGSRRDGWHPDLPDACAEPFIPCSGSRSWSCSGACRRAAPQNSSRTAPCRTELSAVLRHLRRRGPDPGGDLSSAFNPPWTLVSHRLVLPICLAQNRSIAYGD